MNGINASASPWIGGSKTPNAPPPALGGTIPAANTTVANPAAGVAPGNARTALNNSTSNIGVPYTRLVPMQSQKVYGVGAPGKDGNKITPTDDLRPYTLAFVQGVRREGLPSGTREGRLTNKPTDNPLHPVPPYSIDMAPGMVGTERFQKLCSFEYLQGYFNERLQYQEIDLSSTHNTVAQKQEIAYSSHPLLNTLNVDVSGATATEMPDLARELRGEGLDGPKAFAAMNSMVELKQGIFTRDDGPFLRGKGNDRRMVLGNAAEPFNFNKRSLSQTRRNTASGSALTISEFTANRSLGDDMAFALLYDKMDELGLLQWKPDGIVLSKGANDPIDAEWNNFLDARDGQLFNIRVQGPGITSTWCNQPELEVLPLDKLFVVIIADVWFDVSDPNGYASKALREWRKNSDDGKAAYEKAKSLDFSKLKPEHFPEWDSAARNLTPPKDTAWRTLQESAMGGKEDPVLTNFRVRLATSSQMYAFSTPRFDSVGSQMAGKATDDKNVSRGQGRSRMGLQLGAHVGEYVIGGWMIGNVLDTAASRAAFPGAGNIGVRTAPNSSALNVNVQIDWWSADRLWHTFMNVDNSIAPRHKRTRTAAPGKKLHTDTNLPPSHPDSLSRA